MAFLSQYLIQMGLAPIIINQQSLTMNVAERVSKISSSNNQSSNNRPYKNFKSSRVVKTPEVHHIGFLKVHKAGSSTMQNMFFRFGLKRNLTFVLPREGNYLTKSPILPVKIGGHYDILAIHTIFRKTEFDKILPPDKINIGIVREPLDRMISAAYYYRDVFRVGYLKEVPRINFIQTLVTHPEKYEPQAFSHTKNSMAMDFGFDPSTRETDEGKILQGLKFLEEEFKLVLIVERFEESLVLMKRYLGWQMSDILYFPSNSHEHARVNLTEEIKTKHKHTCFLDYAIYDFFSKLFDYKVEAEGPGFQEEVGQLRNVIQQTKSFCNQPTTRADSLKIRPTEWNAEFEVLQSDCEMMKLRAINFIENLRTRHQRMNNISLPANPN